MKTITLDAQVMQAIAGHLDEVLRLIEQRFKVRLAARGTDVTVRTEGVRPEHGGNSFGSDHVIRGQGTPSGQVRHIVALGKSPSLGRRIETAQHRSAP